MTPFICIIDDDTDVGQIIGAMLNFRTVSAASKTEFAKLDATKHPVACFVDIHLDGNDNGLDLIPIIKEQWPATAIFVMTSDMGEEMIGEALAAGANDFLKKPARATELKARFNARVAESRSRSLRDTVRIHDLYFNYRLRRLSRDEKTSHLSPLGAELFQLLAEAKSDWLSKSALKRRLWGGQSVSDNALDQRIREVRRALVDLKSSAIIVSRYGEGIGLRLKKLGSKVVENDETESTTTIDAPEASGF